MPDTKLSNHKPHEMDVLIVCNVDTDCDVTDTEENYPHKDYFQVRWAGHPHRIGPGLTKKMPRFLAEHYAKHLADHMLLKMEEKTNRKGLMQSSFERPKMIERIILGVDTWFLGDNEAEEGGKVAGMVDQLNPGERPLDLGEVPSPMMGVLKPEPKKVVVEDDEPAAPEKPADVPPAPTAPENPPESTGSETLSENAKPEETSIYDPAKPKPTKKQLVADCEKLGIEITGKETVDQLIAKIKAF